MKALLYEIGWRLAFVICTGLHVVVCLVAWACVVIAIYGLHAASVELDGIKQDVNTNSLVLSNAGSAPADDVMLAELARVPAAGPDTTQTLDWLIWWDVADECCSRQVDDKHYVYPPGVHVVGWVALNERTRPRREHGYWVSRWFDSQHGMQTVRAYRMMETKPVVDPETVDLAVWPKECRQLMRAAVRGQPEL